MSEEFEVREPCPCCGKVDLLMLRPCALGIQYSSDVFCRRCGVKIGVDKWNTRTPQNEWISVDDFKPTKHCYVHAYCNDIVNGWVELLKVYVCHEYGNHTFENLDGDDYECIPAIITHVKLVDEPTPPKEI